MLTRVASGLMIGLALTFATRAAAVEEHSPAAPGKAAVTAAAEHGTAEHGKAEEHGEANPLSFQSDLSIWTGVIFLILLAILWKFAWGPIADGLDKREKVVADHLAEAERVNREARELLQGYQKKLNEAQDEVRGILDQARREAEQNSRLMLDKARQEAQREQEKAVHEIELATAGALKELAERSAALAVDLAGRIVRAKLRPEDHATLIQDAVSHFATAKPNGN